MRIRVLSDLHLECRSLQLEPVPCDLVILAGDTNLQDRGLDWAMETFPGQPVLYLAGNHEYYGAEFPGLIDHLKKRAAGSLIEIMENDSFSWGGYRFFGATLWTDMELLGNAGEHSERALATNDYRSIRHSHTFGPLTPSDTRFQHEISRRALESFLEEGDPRRSIVITHHAPSHRSVPVEKWNDPLSPSYASSLDDLILRTQPLLWIHGHIHVSQRYRIGDTTILSNPRGYYNQLEGKFDPNLVLNLDVLREKAPE